MKKLFTLLLAMTLLIAMVGCSDDDPPTGNDIVTDSTATTEWDAAGYWSTNIDATNGGAFTYYSFTSKDTAIGIAKPTGTYATGWDVAFRREEVKTNGGASTSNGGDVMAATLGAVDFDAVSISDTTGANWSGDEIDYFIDSFYIYTGPPTHQFLPTSLVFSMLDATGEHYLKFRVDSMVNLSGASIGDVYITYYYQDTAETISLAGATSEAVIHAGDSAGYFDFSTGTEVFPTDPSTSMDWDLRFTAFDIAQNSGPNGPGDCAAFFAYGELTDGTDIDAFFAQPNGAPMFPDIAGSAMTDWYTYTGPPSHQLYSNSDIYLIKTGDVVYKLKIESYYGEAGDKASASYHFIWVEL